MCHLKFCWPTGCSVISRYATMILKKGGVMRYFAIICYFLICFMSVLARGATADVSVCFTPRQECEGELLQLINSAKHTIRMQTYSFTLYKVAHALVKMKQKGVDVQVIMDKSQFQCGQFSQASYLRQHGISVFDDDVLNIAHNKIIIVDGEYVETGSFNYTSSAEHYNAENMVFIDSAEIARQYLDNWQWRQSQSHAAPAQCLNAL